MLDAVCWSTWLCGKELVKLTPWANFINTLRAAFTTTDPERAKKTIKLSVFSLRVLYLCSQKLLEECWWNWRHDSHWIHCGIKCVCGCKQWVRAHSRINERVYEQKRAKRENFCFFFSRNTNHFPSQHSFLNFGLPQIRVKNNNNILF